MSDPGVRDRRVVITGVGAVTPLGHTAGEFWRNLVAGQSGIARITLVDPSPYPCQVAGEVKNWEPQAYLDRKTARRMGRVSQFMVTAAQEALTESGIDLEGANRDRIGVLLGCGGGSYADVQAGAETLVTRGGMKMDPLYFAKTPVNMPAAQVALQFGLRGFNSTVSTACASATQAIGEAMMAIRAGRADAIVAGGCEAGITDLGIAGFAVMRALTSNLDPETASRPFDAERDGFVPAEGAGALLVESEEHATARGATILAELAGFGCTNDAFHIVAPADDGGGAARAMQLAMQDAGIGPEDVDYINAHATSTPLGDVAETRAIKRVFGEGAHNVAISATKSLIGHGIGASGGMETVAAVQTLRDGVIHPTINLRHPDPECDLDYVPNEARTAHVSVLLKNSFGFGGQNACLVLRRYDG